MDQTSLKAFALARAQGRRVLDELSAKSILSAYGITVPRGVNVPPHCEPTLDSMAPPFVAKLISPDVIHKSDIGGVRVGLADASAACRAVRDLEELADTHGMRLDGVLVEEMAPAGLELVIGGVIDARFGPVLMLGFGGVFVEILKDTAFRVCPITRWDAEDMVHELRGAPLLHGARGRQAVDLGLIIETLLALGGDNGFLIALQDEIAELDINPLIVSAKDAYACDARIVLAVPAEP
jgi:acetyl-CoA synthetase (ADP-forming)